MKGQMCLVFVAAALVACSAPTGGRDVVSTRWSGSIDRRWVGPGYWANRLQDWRVRGGRLECVADRALSLRTVHDLTRRLADAGSFRSSVELGLDAEGRPLAPDAAAGVLLGVTPELDPRAAALVQGVPGRGAGLFVGVDATGSVFVRDLEEPLASDPIARTEPHRVAAERLTTPEGLRLTVAGRQRGEEILLRAVLDFPSHAISLELNLPAARFVGGCALVSHAGHPNDEHASGRAWFGDWTLGGTRVERGREQTFGPVVSCQYTVSGGVLALTAQLVPLEPEDPPDVTLELAGIGRVVARWEAPSYTAAFRVDGWDADREVPFRIAYAPRGDFGELPAFEGVVRAEPKDGELVLAAFTGHHMVSHRVAGRARPTRLDRTVNWETGLWFPHGDVVRGVRHHDPDLLFFSGDQVYEGASPTFADRANLELDYLYKWYLWCWTWRDETRRTPSVVLPDDHDVYQGNVWGHGGRAADRMERGGYVHPASFVRMVERTQTSHLPDPFDPRPIEQDIPVAFTALDWGGVSFAILEDRKFKSGCMDPRLPPTGTKRPDHIADPSVDVAALDLPGLSLLGERQLAFLAAWAEPREGIALRAALSQTVFANMATHHGANLDRLVCDLDSNGWPQSGRARAIAALRNASAVHVAGDQHLATVVHHGLESHRDAIWSFCVPSVANFYPRQWLPEAAGANRRPGEPEWMGDHLDGFGNRVTVFAATNPRKTGLEPRDLHDGMPGYGIVRFDTARKRVTFECWPRSSDPSDPARAVQYPGWPITVPLGGPPR